MHELLFAEVVSPFPVTVLNLPLRRYSLGHELRLLRARNALLCLPRADFDKLPIPQQTAAIIHAAVICADDWLYRQKLETGSLFNWRIRLHNWTIKKLLRRFHPSDYTLAIAEFRNYLEAAHKTMPGPDARAAEICADATGYEPMSKMRGRALGSPELARLLDFVSSRQLHQHYGFAHAFDFPYSLALNLYCVNLETEGRLWIENVAEAEEKTALSPEKIAEFLARPSTLNPRPSTGLATPPPDMEGKDA